MGIVGLCVYRIFHHKNILVHICYDTYEKGWGLGIGVSYISYVSESNGPLLQFTIHSYY